MNSVKSIMKCNLFKKLIVVFPSPLGFTITPLLSLKYHIKRLKCKTIAQNSKLNCSIIQMMKRKRSCQELKKKRNKKFKFRHDGV